MNLNPQLTPLAVKKQLGTDAGQPANGRNLLYDSLHLVHKQGAAPVLGAKAREQRDGILLGAEASSGVYQGLGFRV